MSDPNRRQFVIATVAAACACLGHCEELLAGPDKPGAAAKGIDVGTLSDYPTDGVSDRFAKSQRILVARADGRVFAFSAVCTHKGRVLTVKDRQTIVCPAHGSNFSIRGTVTKPPAKSTLARYRITLNDKQRLVVDKGKTFRESEWDQDGAFVAVK
jgi:nitrite reductase/ring-hydroxylating ferredoxin subunit